MVEDEATIADLLTLYLKREGLTVHVATTGTAALADARRLRPAAIILDITLPDMDGLEVCRRLRDDDDLTPVLFVTARDDEFDRVLGLELGGDDYITKPFSPREVIARLRAVLRRSTPVPTRRLALGAIQIDLDEHRVTVGSRATELTTTEFALLAHLAAHPGRVFRREHLLATVWGYRGDATSRTVDVHIAQLRAKLGPNDHIRTVRGVGYSAEA